MAQISVERSELQRINGRIPEISSAIANDISSITAKLDSLASNIKNNMR